MTNIKSKEYQLFVQNKLKKIHFEVEREWVPFRGEGRGMYSPRVDVAVGPFAINRKYISEYESLLQENKSFVELLIDKHNENVDKFGNTENKVCFNDIACFNKNARCLFCIEIEKSGGRKHCIGDLVNASALGRIGILVAWNEKVLKMFLRQRNYMKFLGDVGKNTFKTGNVLILMKEQFNDCLGTI